MAPKDTAWDDDDEDTPLAFVVQHAAEPKAQPKKVENEQPAVRPQEEKKQAAQKKAKDAKKQEPKAKKEKDSGKVNEEWMDVDKLLKKGKQGQKKGLLDNEVLQKNASTIILVVFAVAIAYFRIVSEGVNFAAERKDQEDPFKILGISSSASDAEIKKTYRTLSLKLHPDKNPDQTPEDTERFNKITTAYKILTDPEKRRRWMNNEDPDSHPLPSETTTITDKNQAELLTSKSAWLILAYADWSQESWELSETWERVGADLGRYINVGRFNFEKETGLAKKFDSFSVPMIYSYIDGKRQTFYGEPTHANLTMFMTKALANSITFVRDINAGAFIEDQNSKPKALLFAQPGLIKLRFAFRAFGHQLRDNMDFSEVQVSGVEKLKKLYGVTTEPAIVFVKEKEAKPLIYSGKMTHARLHGLFQRHQYHHTPRLNIFNYKDLCGAGLLGRQPCVVYLHNPSSSNVAELQTAQGVLRQAATLDLKNSFKGKQDTATAFTWADLGAQSALKAALKDKTQAKLIALDAVQNSFLAYEGDMEAGALVNWTQALSGHVDGDFDTLGGPVTLGSEWRYYNYKLYLRDASPHLMVTIAVLAIGLLVYALWQMYIDLKSSKQKEKFKKTLDKTRQKLMESEKLKKSKWELMEKQNKEAVEKKRMEAAEKEKKREEALKEKEQVIFNVVSGACVTNPLWDEHLGPRPELLSFDRSAPSVNSQGLKNQSQCKTQQQTEARNGQSKAEPPKPKPMPKKEEKAAPSVKPVEQPKPAPAPKPAPVAQPPKAVTDSELKAAIAGIVSKGDLNTLTKRSVREALQAKYPSVDLLSRKELIMGEIEAAVQALIARSQN